MYLCTAKKIFKYPKNPTLATNEWSPPIFGLLHCLIFLEASFSEALNVAHALMFLFTCKNFLCPVAKSCRSLWWSWHLIVLFFVDLISLSYLVFSGQWSVAKIHQSPRDFLFSYFCFSFVSFAFSICSLESPEEICWRAVRCWENLSWLMNQ